MFLRILLIWLAVLLLPATVSAGEVVLLHSTSAASAWSKGVRRGLVDELKGVALVTEVFLGRATDDVEHFQSVADELFPVWGGRTPVAVVADGPLAFAFIRKYRDDLFQGAPVLYCGMPRPESEYLRQCGDCSGIPLEFGVAETLEFLFSLRPDTSMIVGIMDGSPSGRRLRKELEAALGSSGRSVQLLFPGHEPGDDGGLTMMSLADVAASVPRSGAVVFLEFKQDGKGEAVDEAAAVRLVAEKSDGPVFVLSDAAMQSAVGLAVGGVVVDSSAQGREAGRMVRRLLAGERAVEMLPETVAFKAVADLTALARLGIAQSALPPDVVRKNPPAKPSEVEGFAPSGMWLLLGGALAAVLLLAVRRMRKSGK